MSFKKVVKVRLHDEITDHLAVPGQVSYRLHQKGINKWIDLLQRKRSEIAAFGGIGPHGIAVLDTVLYSQRWGWDSYTIENGKVVKTGKVKKSKKNSKGKDKKKRSKKMRAKKSGKKAK